MGLSVGIHTVSFSGISGWTTPINQTVSVSANSTATATGAYVQPATLAFTWTTNNGTITITGYTGPGGAVIIPSTITGRLVTTIGNGEASVFEGHRRDQRHDRHKRHHYRQQRHFITAAA